MYPLSFFITLGSKTAGNLTTATTAAVTSPTPTHKTLNAWPRTLMILNLNECQEGQQNTTTTTTTTK